jgi:hypothetical protein
MSEFFLTIGGVVVAALTAVYSTPSSYQRGTSCICHELLPAVRQQLSQVSLPASFDASTFATAA